VRSNAGGGNAQITVTDGAFDCQYTDFTRVGDGSSDALIVQFLADYALTHTFANCVWDSSSGQVRWGNSAGANGGWSVDQCKFLQSGSPLRTAASTAPGAGVPRSLTFCVFYSLAALAVNGSTVEDCVFEDSFANTDSGATWASFARNFVRQTAPGTSQISGASFFGDATDVYLLADNQNGNPHIALPKADATYDGFVFEYTGLQAVDGGDGFYFSDALTLTVKNCIVLPSSGDGSLTCNLLNANAGAVCDVYHNTYFCGYQGGLCIGDVSESVGIYRNVKGNLGWVGTGYSGGTLGPLHVYSAHNSTAVASETLDVLTPANATHNAGWNLTTVPPGGSGVKGYNGNFSATPGANDVDLDASGGPDFVDATRNFQNWAVSKGAASGGDTQAVKIAAGLALLADDPSLVGSDLLPWVRAGFAPRNAILRGAAHDGGDIGAVPVQVAATGTLLLSRRRAA
jgi:hypothetical protein